MELLRGIFTIFSMLTLKNKSISLLTSCVEWQKNRNSLLIPIVTDLFDFRNHVVRQTVLNVFEPVMWLVLRYCFFVLCYHMNNEKRNRHNFSKLLGHNCIFNTHPRCKHKKHVSFNILLWVRSEHFQTLTTCRKWNPNDCSFSVLNDCSHEK